MRELITSIRIPIWSTLLFLIAISILHYSVDGVDVLLHVDGDLDKIYARKKDASTDMPKVEMPKAPQYYCDIYCRDSRESVIWSNRYDFSNCKCTTKRVEIRAFTEKDVESFWGTHNNYEQLKNVFGESETLQSRLARSYKVFTPVAAFMFDVLVFIVGMYWGSGFGTTAAVMSSFVLFFSKGGSFYNNLLSAAIRIAIGQVSPGMRNFNYVAIVSVMVQVLMVVLGTTAGPMIAVPLLFLASLTANGIIVMLTQSNKFRMDVVVSIILITMQFIQTVGEILPIHFVPGRSYINLMVLIVRALCNSSTSNSDLATLVVHSDVTSAWASMPISVFSMFEDLETAFFALIILFIIIRFASIISMRLMLAHIPFKNPEKQHSFAQWTQRIAMTCLYFPFKHFNGYTLLQAFVNLTFFLWTFRCSLEVFIILVIAVVVSWMVLGEFCVDFDIAKGKVNKARKEAAEKIEKHLLDGDSFESTLYAEMSVPELIIDRHIDFLKKSATMPAEAVKMLHQWDVAIRTSLGKASAVVINRNELLTVKHVFMNVASALPGNVSAYAVHVNGMDLIPYEVRAGNSDIDGETILKLSFREDISKLRSYPAIGPLVVEDYAMHMMAKQGGFSFTHEVFDVDGRTQLIGYGHDCVKSDSGRAGYAIDGTPKLVSLHVGRTAQHNCGLLIHNPERPFRIVASEPLDDDRNDDDRSSAEWYVNGEVPETPPIEQHVGVRETNTPVDRPTDPLVVNNRLKRSAKRFLMKLKKQYETMGKETTSVVTVYELLCKLE